MKVIKKFQYMLLLGGMMFAAAACEEEEPVNHTPTVVTGQATDVYRKGAFLSGSIQNPNGAAIKEYGIMVSEFESMAEPTEYRMMNSQSLQTFTLEAADLTPKTEYFYCAYASSGASTVKGQVKNFTTPESNAPVFGEVELSGLGAQSVTVASLIQDDGGSDILMHGFCWKLIEENEDAPTVKDNVVNVEIGPKEISATVSGLMPEQEYLVCPYGVNSSGVGYGRVVKFSTLSASAPVLTDIEAVDSTDLSYTVKAVIGDKGKSTITRIGFCWSAENKLPTVEDLYCELPDQLGASTFQYTIDKLSYMTTYYIRAYAENEHGVSYSDVLEFTTNYSGKPVLVDVTPTDSTVLGVVIESKLFGEGKSPVSRAGFCWSETNPVPTVEDEVYEQASVSVGTVMKHSIKDLKRETTYYIRAFAENQEGIGYSSVYAFTTKNPGVGIYSLGDLIAFRDARNAGQSVAQWKDSEGVINVYTDIDASSIAHWEPIDKMNYGETFEGNGHAISGLKIEYVAATTEKVVLSFIKQNFGVIRNLTVGGQYKFGEQSNGEWYNLYVGAICGDNYSIISNCISEVEMQEILYSEGCGSRNVAGIACTNEGTIEECSNRGSLTAVSCYACGIAGWSSGTVRSCKNYGTITNGYSAGSSSGISSDCSENAVIEDCINYGIISAGKDGRVAGISSIMSAIVRKSVNEGDVIGGFCRGGIVAECNTGAVLSDCVNRGDVRADASATWNGYGGGIVGWLHDGVTYENNTNNGTVNGALGSEDNAIGNDERAYSNPGIYSLDDLVAFRDAKNSGLSITKWKDNNGVINIYADIDASSIVNWKPISSISGSEIIEGNGHTLSGLNYTEYWDRYDQWGFVAWNDGIIRNLNISANVSISDKQTDGNGGTYVTTVGVVAAHSYGEIASCQVTVNNAVYPVHFGGIVGFNLGKLRDCVTRGKVSGPLNCGGICITNSGTIDACTNYAYISSEQLDVAGGIACYQTENAVITDCVNEGDVIYRGLRSFRGFGGIVGWQMNVSEIKGCTNNASIDAHENEYGDVGGIVGKGNEGVADDGLPTEEEPARTIIGCKNTGEISGGGNVGNICGSLGGANSTLTGCTYGGTVNGEPGTEANAIGYDARYE
ncbi:MAG: hypothetical protein IJX44_03060 [Bacteroidaceae bacterium]|nr:hypothetical protein [Bacteroidaceae bacterium]